MLISDHIATAIPSPLIGANIDELGERFPDMSEVYSHRMREIVKEKADKLGIELREGVYVQLTGPSMRLRPRLGCVKSSEEMPSE